MASWELYRAKTKGAVARFKFIQCCDDNSMLRMCTCLWSIHHLWTGFRVQAEPYEQNEDWWLWVRATPRKLNLLELLVTLNDGRHTIKTTVLVTWVHDRRLSDRVQCAFHGHFRVFWNWGVISTSWKSNITWKWSWLPSAQSLEHSKFELGDSLFF